MKIIVIVLILFIYPIYAYDNFTQKSIVKFEKQYGKKRVNTITLWDNMIQKAKVASDLQKLKYVNDFFNSIRYITDIKHWHQNDYWASPFEFVGTNGGDCEDYAIAKYFTLLKVGIAEDKLRIAYVKLKHRYTRYDEAHMVLLYFHQLNMIPIVLDNVNKKLQLASKRVDLKLIYSFNAKGLWEAKNKGREHIKRGSNNLQKWKKLIEKI